MRAWIYVDVPPVSCCSAEYQPSVKHLLTLQDYPIINDFNANHNLWNSNIPGIDRRGEDLADEIDDSDYGVLNEQTILARMQTLTRKNI